MHKKIIFFIFVLFALSTLSGYITYKYMLSVNNDKNKQTHINKYDEQENTIPAKEVEPIDEVNPLKEQIGKMTLADKLGQMVIVGLDGYSIDDNTKKLIENYHVGGFILFGENVQSTNQLLNLVNSLKITNSKNDYPLFISVDEEGGRIDRMPSEFKRYPTNKKIGQINNSDLSFKIGSIIGEEIKAFGFNMNFAPVLDINSNPNNPVIGDRSFSAKSEIVSKLGIQTMKGIQASQVIPVGKHFPGHGDTSVDSHVGLPLVNNDLIRLKNFELLPFADAIKNDLEAVMIAHILLPKIDSKNPASLSKIIITDTLRGYLNFNGVVITDDMTMGAITKNYSIGDAAIKSINAGTDIILVCHGYDNEVTVINSLKNAVENGTIENETINNSVYRILMLKQKYNLTNNTIDTVSVENINNKINEILKPYVNK